jgi:hypothetical protein
MSFKAGIKTGGGFWNGVDGVLQGYEFTNIGPSKDGKGDATEWVYLVPKMLVDGAKVITTQHLFMGALDRYAISDDGQTVTSSDDRPATVGGTTPAGRFLTTLIDCEPKAESLLPDLEAGEPINLSGIVGTRLRLEQEKDEKGTQKRGKRLDAAGKPTYDRTNTIVTRVYALPNGAASRQTASTSKQNGQTTIDEIAAAAIIAALTKAKDQTLPKAKLMVPVLQFIGGDISRKQHQQAVQKRITEDTFLATIEGVTFDGTSLSL